MLYSCAPTDPTDPWGYVLPTSCTAPDVVCLPDRTLQCPLISHYLGVTQREAK